MSDIIISENDIVYATRNLHKWTKDEKPSDVNFPYALMKPKIRKDPLGCVLIIGLVSVSDRDLSCPDLLRFGHNVLVC
jgi:beta-apo-4'-carotenal oxygenase